MAAVAVLLVLELLGVDMRGWVDSLWDALTAVDPEYVALGLVLQTLETLLAGIAWVAVLRAAYPTAQIGNLAILAAYAVAVAGNDVLPASLGTLVMLVMLTAIIPESTFPGLVGGQVVHKLFFVAAGGFVYLYLFLTVPGSFSLELSLLDEHRGLAVLVPAVAVVVLALVIRAFWDRLRGLWSRAKQGGAILSEPRGYVAKVLAPEVGAWLCKLGVIAVFLAAYGIPVSLHTVMTVAGGNSLANVVSVTPGGAGVNQAVNSATLTREDVDRATALAYSAGQQLVTTAWNVLLAVVLVALVFGWSGGKDLVSASYREAKSRAPRRKRGQGDASA
ncbi:MAG TPA: lysylphosphatidylglycerol synthase domain-containing protein [Gaiellaceae bacterium]|nr:lysylphosphatidylglycerol synthase domain-containing protein [Gaiellaceae bacterium]